MFPQEIRQSYTALYHYLAILDIGIEKVKDEDMLLTAFVHKSYAADFTYSMPHNERLEFLGDGILGAIINTLLFQEYAHEPESKLTLYKISLVREETLAQVARDIDLGRHIFLGKWEQRQGGSEKDAILADALEALIGFVYVDSGMECVERLVSTYIYPYLGRLTHRQGKSYKSLVQEYVQKKYHILPEYDTYEQEEGYEAKLLVQDKQRWQGAGRNKKKAQESAAKQAYEEYIINETW